MFWLTRRGPRFWLGVLVAAASATGALALAAGPSGPRPRHALALRPDVQHVPVDAHNRALRGPDGEPLRATSNGTAIDTRGHAVRGRHGEVLKVHDGHVPAAAVTPLRRHASHGPTTAGHDRRRVARAHTRHGNASPTPASTGLAPVVVGVTTADAAAFNRYSRMVGLPAHMGDLGAQADAVARAINADGGIGGRRLELRHFKMDVTDGQSLDTHMEQACQAFASGNRPLAVLNGFWFELPCLTQHGMALFSDNPANFDSAFESRYPENLYGPGSLALDRYVTPYVHGLAAQDFFSGKVKVGLLRWTDANYDPAGQALKGALAAAGVSVTASDAVAPLKSVTDVADFQARMRTDVVRFHTLGVNRIVSLDSGDGVLLAAFLQQAEPQGYHPRYGLSSLNAPAWLHERFGSALKGAVGVGWAPLVDVAEAQDPGSGERDTCSRMFSAAHVDLGDRSAYGEFAAYAECTELLAIRKALAHAKGVSLASLRSGMEELGAGVRATDLGGRLGPGRHQGSNAIRPFHFDLGCSCFVYGSPESAP